MAILVVDDHDVVSWGFRLMLGGLEWVERCISAHTGAEALALCARYQPHVALVDVLLDGESGAEVCERLRAQRPAPRVILMSGAGGISARAARAAGAAGFISKDRSAPEIAELIRVVGCGGEAFEAAEAEDRAQLTDRESEILALLAGGATNREIAAAIYLSPHTVKEHVSALFRKLGARNRAEAVLRAQRSGLLR
jgi:two-component system response regulator DesR